MKKILAVLGLMFLLSFIISPLNAVETRLIWNLDWEGLNVAIYTPYQAYPNATMTIRIRVEAREDLENVSVLLKIYGSKSEGYLLWYNPLEILDNIDLSSGVVEDQYFNVSIPESVDPGLLHALVSCSWKVWRESLWQERTIDDASIYRMTYLRNKPYEDLQVAYDQLLTDYNFLQMSYGDLEDSLNDLQANYSALLMSYEELLANYKSLQSSFNSLQTNYDSLNSTYQSLLSDYSSLQDNYNELKSKYEFAGETANTRNLMYVFIETTVIFITTTIYFARGRIYSALGKEEPKQTQPS